MPFRARCNPATLLLRRNAFLSLRSSSRSRGTSLSLAIAAPYTQTIITCQDIRHSSTSSLFDLGSFFSRSRASPRRPFPQASQAEFLAALAARDIPSLQRAYDGMTRDASPSPSLLLSSDQLLEALCFLSSAPSGLPLLRRIHADLPTVFGYDYKAEHQQALLDGLLNAGSIEEALDLAKALDPSVVDWRRIMRAAAASGDFVLVEEAADHLRQLGQLDVTDCTLLLTTFRSSSPPLSQAELRGRLTTLLSECRDRRVTLDEAGQAELIRIHILLGELERASDIARRYQKGSSHGPGMWNARVELAVAANDRATLQDIIHQMQERDGQIRPPQRALVFLATQHLGASINSRSSVGLSEVVAAIEHAEKACNVPASSNVWAETIGFFLAEVRQHDALDIALAVYDEARGRGVEVDVEMAKNLIVPLCNARKGSRLPDAMRIYEDLMSLPTPSSSTSTSSSPARQNRFGGIYHYLLLACTRHVPPALPTALRLLTDMRHLSLQMTSDNLTSLLILLMRTSTDHESAFNIYAHFHALDPRGIDEQGFTAILTAYLGLSFPETGSIFAPPELFVGMMKDMQRAGYPPGSHILSALLKQYATQATRLRRSRRPSSPSSASSTTTITSISTPTPASSPSSQEAYAQIELLSQAIRDIHTLIKLDPLISPDIPLLTALMDAYSRSGAYSETFEVFDELIARRPREPKETLKKSYAASINVILDTCGWSYSLLRARKAWAWARRWGLAWEKEHWDAWVECLARCGELEEAAIVVLEDMGGGTGRQQGHTAGGHDGQEAEIEKAKAAGTGAGAVPKADKETVRMLMKFVRRDAEQTQDPTKREVAERVARRVRERYGEWWDEVGYGARR